MIKKCIGLGMVCLAAAALLPNLALAATYRHGSNYNNGYNGGHYGNRSNYNYNANYYDGRYYNESYRSARVIQDNSRRNAAAYPGYINYNYSGCNYNYGYNNSCGCNYQTYQNYYDYNPAATAIYNPPALNCVCPNQYYTTYPVVYRTF